MTKKPPLNIFLLGLLLVSFIIRIGKIDNLPLFGDEVDVGNQAYSLLKTGKDYKGNFLPTYLSSFNEARAPLLIYTTIPAIALFGLTPLAVRLAPIIFGLISIYFFSKLVEHHSQNPKLALLSATIMAFSPWHFHYSRSAFEVTLLLSLLLSATYFFKTKKVLSLTLFALSFYAYNTSNIFTPLIVAFLFFTGSKSSLKPKTFLLPLLISLPILINIISGNASSRFNLISIFNNPKSIQNIITQRTDFSSSQKPTERIFHNKANSWLNQFSQNYLTSISPAFLFLTGDPNPRHALTGFGLLPYIFFPILLLGLYHFQKKQSIFLFWLLVAPIASCLTQDGGTHATRLFILLPPLCFFIAQGILRLRKTLLVILVLFTLHFYLNFAHQYFIHYPKKTFESWQFGYQQLFSDLPPHPNRLFVSNRKYSSLGHFIFYQKTSPHLTQDPNFTDQERPLADKLTGFSLNQNTYFITNWDTDDVIAKISQIAQPNDVFTLFQGLDIPGDWDFSTDPPQGFKAIKTIKNPNHTIFAQVIQKQ